MVSSLRYTIYKIFGKICYLHYFKRMIKDYESRKWDFDIRTIVKNVKVEIPCPKYICKRGNPANFVLLAYYFIGWISEQSSKMTARLAYNFNTTSS